MNRGVSWATIVVGVWATLLSPSPIQADPPDCDNKCRARQYFMVVQSGKNLYRKYDKVTCEHCIGARCTVNVSDTNTGAGCKIKAGEESANKYWSIDSKTVCDWDPAKDSAVESESATPTNPMMFITAPKMTCF